ncbi:E3 ubiquitin-protein ligase RMA1-like [Typha latifolia]|uniref:E3 ubiquitin-protein ligase RMA1-like n=1 Tax=Typha latifolia TaxID=4733 RepID=UPI003C2C4C47
MEVEGIVQGFLGDSMENSQPKREPSNATACFDCNICLDFAADPVVTLCGHLYCWPCIYKWLQVESASLQQCPVCKAPLSENSLVPLYGHGLNTKEGSDQSLPIPSRPSVRRDNATVASMDEHHPPLHSEEYLYMQPTLLQQQQQQQQHQQQQQQQQVHYYGSPDSRYFPSDLSLSAGPVYHPTAGPMLGGTTAVMLQWMFRNNGDEGLYYSGPNNLMVGGNSPRMRRHQMQVENVLHQMWLFLFGFAVIFLLLS